MAGAIRPPIFSSVLDLRRHRVEYRRYFGFKGNVQGDVVFMSMGVSGE